MFTGKQGDCLLIETNLDGNGYIKSHLFVLVLNSENHTKNTIIVNIQTLKGGTFDKTVVLHKGDHPFIDKDSYVNYRLAAIRSLDDLQKQIQNGSAVVKPPMPQEIIQKICQGMSKSPATPIAVLEMYKNYIFENL